MVCKRAVRLDDVLPPVRKLLYVTKPHQIAHVLQQSLRQHRFLFNEKLAAPALAPRSTIGNPDLVKHAVLVLVLSAVRAIGCGAGII